MRKLNRAAVWCDRWHESTAEHIADLGDLFVIEVVHIEVENAAAIRRKINTAAVRTPHRAAVDGAVVHQFFEFVALVIKYPDVFVSVRLPDTDGDFLSVRTEARCFKLVLTFFAEPIDVLCTCCLSGARPKALRLLQQRHRCEPRFAEPVGHEYQPGAIRRRSRMAPGW